MVLCLGVRLRLPNTWSLTKIFSRNQYLVYTQNLFMCRKNNLSKKTLNLKNFFVFETYFLNLNKCLCLGLAIFSVIRTVTSMTFRKRRGAWLLMKSCPGPRFPSGILHRRQYSRTPVMIWRWELSSWWPMGRSLLLTHYTR